MKLLKKVLFVATVVKTHIMEFHVPALELFKRHGWETAVAARNDYDDSEECVIPFCDTYSNIPFERSPFKMANWKAYKVLKTVIKEGEYDIIHCHTPVGSVLTRLAAIEARKKGTKVIYTAHGFHFYKGAPLKNWLLYFPVEWLLSHVTDVLITINKEDYARAQKFGAKKVCYVPGVGLDFSKFEFKFSEEDKLKKRRELGVPEQAKMLVSVGELNRNKNHEVIIHALAKLNDKNIHYCIAGKGDLHDYLRNLADELGVGDQVHLLGYRRDVAEIYKSADLCCFPSYREGLPVSVLEGMACGLPVVAADNRGTRDIILDEECGLLCPAEDVDAFAKAIEKALNHENIISCAEKTDIQRFSVENVLKDLKSIYLLN